MSDKDWKKEALALVVLLRAKCSDEEWAEMESRFECTAPAPQPADEIVAGLLLRGIEYCAELADEGTPWESVAEPEPQYFATFLEAYDFQIEMAATPQVTPKKENK